MADAVRRWEAVVVTVAYVPMNCHTLSAAGTSPIEAEILWVVTTPEGP